MKLMQIKSPWLEFSTVGGRVYVGQGEIVAIMDHHGEDGFKSGCRLMLRSGDCLVVDGTVDTALKIINDNIEEVPSLGSVPSDTEIVLSPEEIKRRDLASAEELGAAMTRGAMKAQKEKDRESWGRPE